MAKHILGSVPNLGSYLPVNRPRPPRTSNHFHGAKNDRDFQKWGEPLPYDYYYYIPQQHTAAAYQYYNYYYNYYNYY